MSNLLDKASIILTPTAYNNGEALCVKPSDGSGDFDFSRNSAATRVNAQGLVENVQILSSNLVQNGDFSEEGVQEVSNGSFSQEGAELVTNGDFATDSDWTKGTGWSIGNGRATYDGLSGTQQIISSGASVIPQIGKTYKVSFDVLEQGSGANSTFFGGVLLSVANLSVGSYVFYAKAVNTNRFSIFGRDGSVFSIDNVSVREVGQDWNLENTWTIGNSVANGNGAVGSTEELTQNNTFTLGKTYKVVYEILNYVSGNIQFQFSGGATLSGTTRSSDGTFTEYVVATANHTLLKFKAGSPFNGSITNISVKEVGQNWILDANWSIAEDKAVSDGTNGFIRTSTNVFESGKTYKVGITVSNMTVGLVSFPYDGASTSYISANGIYETIYTPNTTNVCYIYGRNGFDGSVTNISVIEISTDTNLPRINYEGFSYQDALGSEEVVNGDGSSTIGWNVAYPNTTLSINNNNLRATANASGAYGLSQILSLDTSKQYLIKATINVDNASGGTGNFRIATSQNLGVNATTLSDTTGTSTTIFTPSASTMYIGVVDTANNSSNYVEIDNISVKEYLGQEVVPDSGCGSWLFEPQSTNLVLTSDSGTYGSTPPSETNTISPDGTNNAIIPTPTANANRYQEGLAGGVYSNGQKFTYSWYRKRISTPVIDTEVGDLIIQALVNLTIFESTTQIQSNINGYDRFQVVVQLTDGSLPSTFRAYFGSIIGVGNSSVAYWGHQFEVGGYATSLIPTEGSTVTRNQDVCNNGGSLASINSTEGVLYAEIAALANGGTGRWISISDGTGTNRVSLSYEASPTIIRVYIRNSGGVVFDFQKSGQTQTDFNKIAVKYKVNDFALWVNGVEVASDFLGNTYPENTLNSLQFNSGGGSSPFFGKTKALAVFPYLSDAELTALTTI